jgi:hypothetical protein
MAKLRSCYPSSPLNHFVVKFNNIGEFGNALLVFLMWPYTPPLFLGAIPLRHGANPPVGVYICALEEQSITSWSRFNHDISPDIKKTPVEMMGKLLLIF